MPSETILSFLAQKHVAQQEVLASDGMVFLLRRSPAARAGVGKLLGLERDDFVVEGQFVTGTSRPDIGLLDAKTGTPLALFELKFWAGLTEAQPSDYLQSLDEAGGGPLCFVAPSRRHVALWRDLLGRAPGFVESGSKRFATRGRLSLRLISWDELLAPIASAVSGSSLQADLEQLRGLVQTFEDVEFRPFQAEDVSNLETPRLVMALANLADDIVHQAESEGTVSIGRLHAAHDRYAAGRYFMVAERAGGWLGLNHRHWVDHGLSPLWLEFRGDAWSARRLVRSALRDMFEGGSPSAFELENGYVIFAVPISLQVERDVAIREGAKFLSNIGARLIEAGLPINNAPPT